MLMPTTYPPALCWFAAKERHHERIAAAEYARRAKLAARGSANSGLIAEVLRHLDPAMRRGAEWFLAIANLGVGSDGPDGSRRRTGAINRASTVREIAACRKTSILHTSR
jgi:hypothetical protein